MAPHRVRALLMGGQACVFCGAAEFSRNTDLLILSDAENLQRLDTALRELQAERIAVPPFAVDFLERGHAVHFRCHHADADEMRVDVMSKLRGVDEFMVVWERRTTITDADGTCYELLALPDLVQAKKTQRSKDWPMLQRLLESHYLQHRASSTPAQQRFWLLELRTPEMLIEAVQAFDRLVRELSERRPLLLLARAEQGPELAAALALEETKEREEDRLYWQPLKAELEQLRHAARPQ